MGCSFGICRKCSPEYGEKMSLRNELIEKLERICDNPENEFDKIIQKNRNLIRGMDEKKISEIYTLRRKAARLCGLIGYPREGIHLLVELKEVDANNKVAELEDCFNIAEYLFEKEKAKK